jgi:hypothetical protein
MIARPGTTILSPKEGAVDVVGPDIAGDIGGAAGSQDEGTPVFVDGQAAFGVALSGVVGVEPECASADR